MAILKAQVIIPYFTNVPRDVATNQLFYDIDTADDVTAATAIANDIAVMYLAMFASPRQLSAICAPTSIIKFYNLDDPEPRTDIYSTTFATPRHTAGTSGYAEEVAVTASFQANAVSGIPQSRRRGRIYLGPLAAACINSGTSTSFSQVNSDFQTAIGTAMAAHVGDVSPYTWVVWSPTTSTAAPVTRGWIDSSPDTIRSRGYRTASRTLWT